MIVNGGGFPLTYSQISTNIQNKKRPLFIHYTMGGYAFYVLVDFFSGLEPSPCPAYFAWDQLK